METKQLKQKCEDCKVNLIHLEDMDKRFKNYILNIKEKEITEEKRKELKDHKTIYCPNCSCAYDKNFKKMKIKLAMLKGE